MMPAKMPEQYVAKPPVPVVQLRAGESGHITFTDVRVHREDLSAYVKADASLCRRSINTVEIRHQDDGYHLVIRDPRLTFSVQEITNASELIPLVGITEELEP